MAKNAKPKQKAKKQHDLPQVIVVRRETDTDGMKYLIAGMGVEDFDDGDVVGYYRLETAGRLQVRQERVLEVFK